MREALLANLPQILHEANKPLEKAGDVRVFALTGGRDGEPITNTLQELLQSYSSLNLFKEMMEFLNSVGVDGSKGG